MFMVGQSYAGQSRLQACLLPSCSDPVSTPEIPWETSLSELPKSCFITELFALTFNFLKDHEAVPKESSLQPTGCSRVEDQQLNPYFLEF